MRNLLRLVVFFVVAALGIGTWFWLYVQRPLPLNEAARVYIPKGAGLQEIQRILVDEGIPVDDVRFLLLARLNGSAGQLRFGEFRIPRGLKPGDVLRILVSGKVLYHPLTFPEGLTVAQVSAILEEAGWIDGQVFLSLTKDASFIKSMGLEQPSLEGYLFPDTYSLVKGESDEAAIIKMMVDRFLQVWEEIKPEAETSMSMQQVVTLASIIEKETGSAAERPLIARVFLNRLNKGMRLQSDPTVIYGIADFNGDLTRADLRKKTPYNTYVIKGLPPGPICNPGKEAMQAVFAPAVSKALYFVSKNDGTHHFSRTLKEHNRAVYKYQIKKKTD